jgi:predicted nucleic acid-binding protein
MSAKCFIDTNILIYALNPKAGLRQVRATELIRELWVSKSGLISTQVLQDLCVNARRKAEKPVSPREMKTLLEEYSQWEVFANTAHSIGLALELEERYQISFWDALILQAAQSGGAKTLYSEDFSHGQLDGGVRVINPFA